MPCLHLSRAGRDARVRFAAAVTRSLLPVCRDFPVVHLLYVEASVYALAKKMMPEYEGGFWHFIRLPDGGGYMMPDGDRFHIVNGANWFDRTVSADACGIILTSLVINRQLWLYHDSGDAGLTQLYRMRDAQLWRHIEFHPECNAIYAALD
ncbi:antirestriction protein [Escherichia coli]|nr:antirestriction protein [Escherichia coli]